MLRRTNNQIHSSGEGQGCHKATLSSIPTRFQRKDPKRPRFDPSLVTKALEGKPRSRSLRQVASALLQKDSKTRVRRQGKEKRLFSVEEERVHQYPEHYTAPLLQKDLDPLDCARRRHSLLDNSWHMGWPPS